MSRCCGGRDPASTRVKQVAIKPPPKPRGSPSKTDQRNLGDVSVAHASELPPDTGDILAGPIFREYLHLVNAKANLRQVEPPCASDCLLVVDMQNDFVTSHPLRNPGLSRFSSSESEDIGE